MPLFGTDGIRGTYGLHPVTSEFCTPLVHAVLRKLESPNLSTVLIGRDTRNSGLELERSLTNTFSGCGVNVVSLGVVASPVLAYMISRIPTAQLGVMITASHNPSTDNGFKFFDGSGHKFSVSWELDVERNIEKQSSYKSIARGKTSSSKDLEPYLANCKKIFGSFQADGNLSIVVDCANGAMSYIAPEVLCRIGFDPLCYGVHKTHTEINDGCGSTYPEYIRARVKEHRADIGIAFDGDGDRVLLVDHTGKLVDGDQILYLLASWNQLTRGNVQGVVGTVMSNGALEKSLADLGISLFRTSVGDRNVASELQSRNLTLGGEPSGHIINRNWSPTGDGLLTALQILYMLSRKQKTLNSMLVEYASLPQVHRSVQVSESATLMNMPSMRQCIADVQTRTHVTRVVVRPSGTEPVLRVMVEGCEGANVDEEVEAIVNTIPVARSEIDSKGMDGTSNRGE